MQIKTPKFVEAQRGPAPQHRRRQSNTTLQACSMTAPLSRQSAQYWFSSIRSSWSKVALQEPSSAGFLAMLGLLTDDDSKKGNQLRSTRLGSGFSFLFVVTKR
jgi:hypothetical protein